MSFNTHCADTHDRFANCTTSYPANRVVLTVLDHLGARPELRQVLQLNGYRVIDTDNGQDAAKSAFHTHPDLLVVDMDVPLLYELVAARQIIKHARVGPMPVVIVTHEDMVDPMPMMEVGASRNEYVTRLSDYQQLQPLLDYLLPVMPSTDYADARERSISETAGQYSFDIPAASAPEHHLHRDTASMSRNMKRGKPVHRRSPDDFL
jgi:PleD family two-component response regulator